MRAELAPFAYAGGKGQAAVVEACWAAFGPEVPTYIEPFFGSGAMLLSRPGGAGKYEVVGDVNGLLANVWRAIQLAPDEVAKHCDWPPTEADLAARAKVLRAGECFLANALAEAPAFFDAQAAGWWIWCQSVSFSPDWLTQKTPPMAKPYRRGVLAPESDPLARMRALSERLRRVGIACGDWSRLVTPSALGLHNTGTFPTAVFLDCPYPDERIDYGLPPVARDVEIWCRENGPDQRLRIVLCGHVGDYDLPDWRTMNWGGSRGWGQGRRGANECLWLSPGCLSTEQLSLDIGGP